MNVYIHIFYSSLGKLYFLLNMFMFVYFHRLFIFDSLLNAVGYTFTKSIILSFINHSIQTNIGSIVE